jgi:hypothetical protein
MVSQVQPASLAAATRAGKENQIDLSAPVKTNAGNREETHDSVTTYLLLLKIDTAGRGLNQVRRGRKNGAVGKM